MRRKEGMSFFDHDDGDSFVEKEETPLPGLSPERRPESDAAPLRVGPAEDEGGERRIFLWDPLRAQR